MANFFLHIFIYSLIPLFAWYLKEQHVPFTLLGWSILAFAIGVILPGPFGAFLMERRSRKGIFLKAILLAGPVAVWMLALNAKSPYLEFSLPVVLLLQGVAYGVAQTALGTTLINDVLLSKYRNKGDLIYGWSGRIGIPVGLLFGYWLAQLLSYPHSLWWTLAPCVLSFVIVAQTIVPIKAPVKARLFSLDRFFLPHSTPLSLSMFAAPWALGRMIGVLPETWAYSCLAIGVLTVFLLQIWLRRRMSQHKVILIAYASLVVALGLFAARQSVLIGLASFLIGGSAGAVSSRHLMDWITGSQHCQRGTAQNTYTISWRMAFSLGFLFSTYFSTNYILLDVLLCVLCAAFYLLRVVPLTKRHGT